MIEFFGPIFDATTPAMWLAAALAGLALGAWAVVDEIRHSRG